VDAFGLDDLMLEHTDQCVHFADQTEPREMDLGSLTDHEVSKLYDAQRNGRPRELRYQVKTNFGLHLKRTMRECREKFGVNEE
jgi:hypothetical protein